MDRLKMIMQIQDASVKGMTIRDGLAKMAAEGGWMGCEHALFPHPSTAQMAAKTAMLLPPGPGLAAVRGRED